MTHRGLVAAVDVGGTAIKGILMDASHSAVARRDVPTPRQGPDAVFDCVQELVDRLLDETATGTSRLAGVGVAVPGIVDDHTGTAHVSANLGWREVLARSELANRFTAPVVLTQDVRAAGLAESHLGAARSADDALVVPVGTGIAGALVVDGRLVTGGGYAGELGHVVVDPSGEPCTCGSRGCLETIASARAIARRYGVRAGADASAREVAAAVAGGDRVAREVWSEATEALATVLATCVTVLGSEVIVLGGGLSGAGRLLLDPVRTGLEERLTFQRRPQVVAAALGELAGCLGAGLLAWEQVV
jgi:glucokinase